MKELTPYVLEGFVNDLERAGFYAVACMLRQRGISGLSHVHDYLLFAVDHADNEHRSRLASAFLGRLSEILDIVAFERKAAA